MSNKRDKEHEAKEFEDVLEAFNAEGAIEHPGRPTKEGPEDTPAADADAQPPG
jgi:hypothetical protein